MQYEDLNIDALKATLDLLFGEQVTEMAQKTYVAFDAAMAKASRDEYQKGFQAGYEQAQSDFEVIEMANDGTLTEIEHQQMVEEMSEQLAYDAEHALYNGDSTIGG